MNSKDWQNQTRNLIAEYKDKKSINRGLTFEKFVNAKDGSQIFLTCVDYPIAPEYKYLAPYDNTIDNEQFRSGRQNGKTDTFPARPYFLLRKRKGAESS